MNLSSYLTYFGRYYLWQKLAEASSVPQAGLEASWFKPSLAFDGIELWALISIFAKLGMGLDIGFQSPESWAYGSFRLKNFKKHFENSKTAFIRKLLTNFRQISVIFYFLLIFHFKILQC